MTSEERRTLMVIEHRLCSDDPDLVAQFTRLGRPGQARPPAEIRRRYQRAGWALAGLFWAAAAVCLVVGGALGVQPLVLAGMLLIPAALWVTLSQPMGHRDGGFPGRAVARGRAVGRR